MPGARASPAMPDWTGQRRRPAPEKTLREAKFVYAVPNYSNPTGVLVPQHARRALLEKVVRAGTWLVEDDPYLPLQLDGAAGPSILAHDRPPTVPAAMTARCSTSERCRKASFPACGSAGSSPSRRSSRC